MTTTTGGHGAFLARVGVHFAAACSSLPAEKTVEKMNIENPSGTANGWMLAKTMPDGSPNPAPAPECEGHQLFYFEC